MSSFPSLGAGSPVRPSALEHRDGDRRAQHHPRTPEAAAFQSLQNWQSSTKPRTSSKGLENTGESGGTKLQRVKGHPRTLSFGRPVSQAGHSFFCCCAWVYSMPSIHAMPRVLSISLRTRRVEHHRAINTSPSLGSRQAGEGWMGQGEQMGNLNIPPYCAGRRSPVPSYAQSVPSPRKLELGGWTDRREARVPLTLSG